MCAERRKRAWDAEWDLKFNGWDLDWGLILLIGISSFFGSFSFFLQVLSVATVGGWDGKSWLALEGCKGVY